MTPSIPVEHLGEAIADLTARMHAATYELLVMLRQFDQQNGWTNGFLSCAHWLSWRTGIDIGAAREKVRVARALPALPRLSGALQHGEISYAKVRALTRVATPENEEQMLLLAYTATAAQVERASSKPGAAAIGSRRRATTEPAACRDRSPPTWTTTAWSSCAPA